MLAKRSHSAPGCCKSKPLIKSRRQRDPTRKTPTPVAEQVENIVAQIFTAINSRLFDPQNSLYEQIIDSDFIGSLRYPWGGRAPTSWPRTLNTFRDMLVEYPYYQLVRPLMYTEVYHDSAYSGTGRPRKATNEEGRYADVFVNFDVEGEPVGVVRQSVAIFRFRRRNLDGAWRCFSLQSLDGCGRCDGLGGVETYMILDA